MSEEKKINLEELDNVSGGAEAFRMEEEEAKEIIARNDDLIRTISIHEYARYIVSECKDFDKDCKALTNNIAGFVYAEPNDVYDLGFVDAGGERAENRLFTDGKTTVIERIICY